MNIGIFIFAVVLIYIIGISVIYLQEHSISTYRVTTGSIINDTAYNALAIREETVYSSQNSGYVQFYHTQGSRVSYDNIIYTLSSTDTSTSSTSSSYTISSSEQESIISEIQSFNKSYSNISFTDTNDLIENIEYVLQSSENDERLSELSEIDITSDTFGIYKISDTGILSYYIDGYEDITLENLTSNTFDRTNYSYTKVSNGDNITSNTSLYKLITDENWYLVFEVTDEDIEIYQDMTSVQVHFTSDGEVVTAPISLMECDGSTYGVLTLKTGMIRYTTSRFLEIELILEDLEGYKIPISSVISQDFYLVPIDYVTKGGTSGSNGIMTIGADNVMTFQDINIYYQDEDYVYLLVEDVGTNVTIIQEETSDLLLLNDIVTLDGVYCVNKGYAEYKLVEILTSSTEYYIVSDSMSYSISNYDHIALYGDSVSEKVIVN